MYRLYGQTGAGKSYTLGSLNESPSDPGLVIRSMNYIFERCRALGTEFSVKLSVVEIYNESLIDCIQAQIQPTSASYRWTTSNLATNGIQQITPSKLAIKETPADGIYISNLSIISLNNETEASTYLHQTYRNRMIGEHLLNSQSSRSHILYTIYISTNSDVNTESRLVLVDLAGSEKIAKTKATGKVLKEANHINKSLSFLEQVVLALSKPNPGYVPYRQSKLTMLLKDSIGGHHKTMLIACIWPSESSDQETLSTLRFATRMKCLEIQAIRPVTSMTSPSKYNSNTPDAMKLKQQIQLLEKELELRNTLIQGSTNIVSSIPTFAQLQSILCQALDITYIKPLESDLWRPIENIEIQSVFQLKLIISILRNCIWESCKYDENCVDEVRQVILQKMTEIHKSSKPLDKTNEIMDKEVEQPTDIFRVSSLTSSQPLDLMDDNLSKRLDFYFDLLKEEMDDELSPLPIPVSNESEPYAVIRKEIEMNKYRQSEIVEVLSLLKSQFDDISTQIRQQKLLQAHLVKQPRYYSESPSLGALTEDESLQMLEDHPQISSNMELLSFLNKDSELDSINYERPTDESIISHDDRLFSFQKLNSEGKAVQNNFDTSNSKSYHPNVITFKETTIESLEIGDQHHITSAVESTLSSHLQQNTYEKNIFSLGIALCVIAFGFISILFNFIVTSPSVSNQLYLRPSVRLTENNFVTCCKDLSDFTKESSCATVHFYLHSNGTLGLYEGYSPSKNKQLLWYKNPTIDSKSSNLFLDLIYKVSKWSKEYILVIEEGVLILFFDGKIIWNLSVKEVKFSK